MLNILSFYDKIIIVAFYKSKNFERFKQRSVKTWRDSQAKAGSFVL